MEQPPFAFVMLETWLEGLLNELRQTDAGVLNEQLLKDLRAEIDRLTDRRNPPR